MKTIAEQIKQGMAKAFFANAWADQAEETGNSGQLSGCDILEIMPAEIDRAALHAADTLAMDVERANSGPFCRQIGAIPALQLLYERANHLQAIANDKGDRRITPELFGHYLAMQAMGTGVGLESFGSAVRDAIRVPCCEFGSYSLEKDYFEDSEEN